MSDVSQTKEVPHVQVAIIGSGFAGIGMAIRLKQSGITDFVILERADAVGGVWRDNTYPNCACDVQSHLYSFSFARNPDWSRSYSPQPEILSYLQRCVAENSLEPFLRFRHEVKEAAWDKERELWRITTADGALTANVLVSGAGGLSDPVIPTIPGVQSFKGKSFHSAAWDHDYDLNGKTVAVIGTGASAIQFVPAIQPRVGKLHVFQRTPAWIVPRRDRAFSIGQKKALKSSRALQLAVRGAIYAFREATAIGFFSIRAAKLVQWLAEHHLKQQVADPVLREKLTPKYVIGCKRILVSDDYLPALTKENVELVTEGIKEIKEHSIVTVDGTERRVDALIFGTGFQVQDLPILKRIRGREGRTLKETWSNAMTAHLGTTVVGFPNLFLLQGPNTGLGHTSVITMIESQIEHVVHALQYMKKKNVRYVEPRPEAQAAFVRDVEERTANTVWSAGGCESWYLDKNGRNSTLWPGFTFTFKRRVEAFNPNEYVAHG